MILYFFVCRNCHDSRLEKKVRMIDKSHRVKPLSCYVFISSVVVVVIPLERKKRGEILDKRSET